MDPLQTTYTQNHDRWVEGMVLNMEAQNRVSRIAEAVIGFGKVAVRGTGDRQVLPATVGQPYLGITMLDRTQLVDQYVEFSMVTVLTKGVIVAQASVAVAAGDAVYFVPATGVLTNVATANTAIPGATWDTSTVAAGLAAIRLA